MKIETLATLLRNNTECDSENIELLTDKDGSYISIDDDFKIRPDEDGKFSVSADNELFEEFTTDGEEVLEFFKGFYDAFVYDEIDPSKSNEYYELGFEFGVEDRAEQEGDEEEEEERETFE
jgi:hypothetical protein